MEQLNGNYDMQSWLNAEDNRLFIDIEIYLSYVPDTEQR